MTRPPLGRRGRAVQRGRDEEIHLARQVGRSLAARWHSDMRAVRLLDGDRLITDVVNYCLPLNHHDTLGPPIKNPSGRAEAAGVGGRSMNSSLAVFQQCGVSDSVPCVAFEIRPVPKDEAAD